MKKRTTALALAALLGLSGFTPAAAEGTTQDAPATNVCLADYMGDDNDAQWSKLQAWMEANFALLSSESAPDCAAPSPAPEPTTEPTTEPSAEPTTEPSAEPTTGPSVTDVHAAATNLNTIRFEARVSGYDAGQEFTFRASAYDFTGQAGYPQQVTVDEDGKLRAEVRDFNNTDPVNWQLEVGGSTWEYGEVIAEGDITDLRDFPVEPSIPAEDAPPAQPVSDEGTSGGSGGPTGWRENVSFSANGLTSTYHILVPEGEGAKGVILWGDGSRAYGYKNPDDPYLLGGENGLRAVAQRLNMILVVPIAPPPGCPSDNCWYDSANAPAKAAWASALLDEVKASYDVRQDQVVVGGYSSGAQFTSRFFIPAHGEQQSVDLGLVMAWGSPGDLSSLSEAYRQSTTVVFNTGTNDTNGGTSYNAYDGAQDGRAAYEAAGFDVDWEESDATHSRGGDFGPFVEENIRQHLLGAAS